MEYISAREAAEKWHISQRRVAILCAEGRITDAQRVGKTWVIPANAEKPADARSLRYVERTSKDAKPFLKWAGGKGQLLNELRTYYPFDGKTITRYAEPFVGGGAVLFDILNRFILKEVYISDTNSELINAYKVVRDNIDELIILLYSFQADYLPLDDAGRRAYYFGKRNRYNEIIKSYREESSIEKAALLLFLNKTCFNGLYRVNSKGLFNVPIGAYKNPLICDEENLRTVSLRLQRVIINCCDFEEAAAFIDGHTFVYLDPPYRPLTETSGFISYTDTDFDDNEQIRLAQFAAAMSKRGAVIVASNSDPKNVDEADDFFDDLYSDFRVQRVSAVRMINSNSAGRGKINELIIASRERGDTVANRVFDTWISSFRDSIADYGYYTDFEKVYRNIEEIKIELNILNSLVGERNIETKYDEIIANYPETLKCIPILLAVRANEIRAIDGEGEYTYKFNRQNLPPEQYKAFMRKTGLFDLLQNHIIGNLVDYATGVETGLDSNGRKNRGGHLMENLVESYIQKAGFEKGKTYFKEMTISQITKKWGIDLSAISNSGKTQKRFDFVIKCEKMIYGIETNFYGSGGSKLNETARSYKTLALETNAIEGFTFVWFTDGKGWTSARHNLEETFDVMEHVYSIDDMENGIIEKVFR